MTKGLGNMQELQRPGSVRHIWRKYSYGLFGSSSTERTTESTNGADISEARPPLIGPGKVPLDNLAYLHDAEGFGEMDVGYLSRLYERATGEPPHEVLVLENGVLIETGVLGSYECFPNGYLPILLSRSRNGWVVFDTGHSASESLLVSADVCCDGDVLYLECETSAQLQGCITRLVRVLRNLNEG